MPGAQFHRGESKQDYATPPELRRAVESRFGPIAYDLAADSKNAVAVRYITEEEDSFTVDWHNLSPGNLLWLNPPFAKIAPWAKKCATEAESGAKIALLVPAAVGSNWFAEHVFGQSLVLLIRPRVKFVGAKDVYPKDLILAVYGCGLTGVDTWRWDR